jgi:hypothetical protein
MADPRFQLGAISAEWDRQIASADRIKRGQAPLPPPPDPELARARERAESRARSRQALAESTGNAIGIIFIILIVGILCLLFPPLASVIGLFLVIGWITELFDRIGRCGCR